MAVAVSYPLLFGPVAEPDAKRSPLRPEVIVLSLASLFNDASSEMIYPLLPIFLTTVLGASPMVAGMIEGLAEALSSILKLVAGRWSDRLARRKPFIVAGYTLAALSRFFIATAGRWPSVLAARLVDRTGKGIRSAPRDAMIAEVTPPAERGRAFGFHRALDHTGAMIGPVIAALLLWRFHLDLRTLFLWAMIPGLIGAALLAFALKEVPRVPAETARPAPVFSVPKNLRAPLGSIALFYLANSSDIFLLLRARDVGIATAWLPLLWSAHHIIKSLFSTKMGALSDRGRRTHLLVLGWLIYAAIYFAFPWAKSLGSFVALFLLYAIPFTLTEGAERAWMAELSGPELQGRTFGFYYLTIGMCLLAGSAMFGWLYQAVSPAVAFQTGSALAVLAALSVLMQSRVRRTA